ncbi:TPA: hypothetical protein HA361_06715 [Candidatus Woesearchaeota archaeon]|nr:hypothetical protein [Candidatus Woesearchaeota archaeon]
MGRKPVDLGELAEKLLNNIFKDPSAFAPLIYILSELSTPNGKITEKTIREQYEKNTLEKWYIQIANRFRNFDYHHWLREQKAADTKQMKNIRETVLSIAEKYTTVLRREKWNCYGVEHFTEWSASSSGGDGSKTVTLLLPPGVCKPENHRVSYTDTVYPSLTEIINGKIVLPPNTSSDSIVFTKAAEVILIERKYTPAERNKIMSSVLDEILEEAKKTVGDSKKKRGRKIQTIQNLVDIVNGKKPRKQLVNFLYNRLNALGYSPLENQESALWDIFTAYGRFNINKLNWDNLLSGGKLNFDFRKALERVLQKNRDYFVPLIIARYGIKDIGRLAEKCAGIIFADSVRRAEDYYRFRLILRDEEECKNMRGIPGIVRYAKIYFTGNYIDNKKHTGYQADHYKMIFPDIPEVEFQITCHQMDFNAHRCRDQKHEIYKSGEKRLRNIQPYYQELIQIAFRLAFKNK